MRSIATKAVCLAALLMAAGLHGGAQAPAPAAASTDPRVGLKGGFHDAGVAVSNMVLLANVPKPESFSDPKGPMGMVIPPETPESEAKEKEKEKEPAKPESNQGPPGLNFSNSDIAFRGNDLFLGNFNGFNIYDIDPSKKAALVASVVCPGGQGDMSIHANLLFMSVEQTRGRLDCGTQGIDATVSPDRFRGVRIFDITDLRKPKQVAAVQTCRGSHTHTLVVDPKDHENVYVYGSGTSTVRSGDELTGCSGADPKEDANTALFSIDVIQVPLAAPEKAKIVNRPRIFADKATGAISGLWPGGDHGPGTQKSNVTNQCHDITVFPELGLAAGACSGNGILLDISDPIHPARLDQVTDKNFAYWHSATFSNDGTKVIFTDEWGGGVRPRCRATDQPTWGADAIFDIVDRKLQFASYYKMPAPQTEQENCVAHNGSLIPVPGRDIMVQAWYQGGVSIFDFTDSAKPVEIAYFDRGPVDPANLILAGFWSAYWYNGRVYGSEIARGLDVFALKPSEFLSQDEIDAAASVKLDEFNPQQQPRLSWAASPVVARAYLDQLTRTKGLTPERIAAVRSAVEGHDKAKLQDLAGQLEQGASSASGRDAARLRSLAETLKGLAKS